MIKYSVSSNNIHTPGGVTMKKVFIDGASGTTGLNIRERLESRDDIEIISADPDKRRDPEERKRLIDAADIVFLCLPDAAADEAAQLAGSSGTVIIDTSTFHRCAPGWTYGFPELTGKDVIKNSKRIANPGCHATGFISSAAPLVRAGIINKDEVLSCFSLTGYSGGGKKMIADYEAENTPEVLASPGIYGLNQSHKHIPEIMKQCGLTYAPVFCPVVAPFRQGMATTISIDMRQSAVKASVSDVAGILKEFYADSRLISVRDSSASFSTVYANEKAGLDSLELIVCGNDDRITVTALFDNLGKGACGSAIQNMNLVLGTDELKGLKI